MNPVTELNSTSEGPSKPRTTSSYAQRRDSTGSKWDFYGNFDLTSSRQSSFPRNRIPRLVQRQYDPSVPEPEVNSRIPTVLPSRRGFNGKNYRTIEQCLNVPRGTPTLAGVATSTPPAVIQPEDRIVVAPSLGPPCVPPRWQEKVRYIQDWIRETHQTTNISSDEANHPPPPPPPTSMRRKPLRSSSLAIRVPGAQPPDSDHLPHLNVPGSLEQSAPLSSPLTLIPRCPAWQSPIRTWTTSRRFEHIRSIRCRLAVEYSKQAVERRRADLELQVAKARLSSAETRRIGVQKTLKRVERFGIDHEEK